MAHSTPPTEFDGYRLVRLVGQGAMGRVYLAHDTILDRQIAIKVVGGTSASDAARKRFIIEARAIARLQHPNVVSIYRVGQVEGRPYLASELIRGTSLEKLAKPLTSARIFEIALGLARGLAAAHARGVLHRDIKPANVMLTEEGEVKLLDFGIAKLSGVSDPDVTQPSDVMISHDPNLTNPGAVVGTPHYMAPELWCDQQASPRSDIYSLGALLYHLSTGKAPHADLDHPTLIVTASSREPPRVLDVAPDIDPRLAAIIDRCLRLDPAARFATAEELRSALSHLFPGEHGAVVLEGNPYRGLNPFEAEHRALYFGRDAETRAILERLRNDALVLIAGDSGVGKSSLCRAGILPRVHQAFGGKRTWTTLTLVPGKHPVTTLAAALAAHFRIDEEALAAQIRQEPSAAAREVRRRIRITEGLVVFIDQLEELVTLAEPQEAAAVAEMVGWLSVSNPVVRILASARGDLLSRLATLPGLGDEISRALYFLRPLSADRLHEAIVGPARALGVRFESDALVDELVASTARTEGGLPLLQFALAALWEQRDKERGLVTAAALDAIGGVSGALSRHADDVIARMPPAEKSAARHVLLALVSPAGARIRRDGAHWAKDANAGAALAALVRGRLVVARQAGTRAATRGQFGTGKSSPPDGDAGSEYEIAHETLLEAWGTLREWLREDADSQRARGRLAHAVVEWKRLERARDALWSARQLSDAAAIDVARLTVDELAFLEASRAAHRRGQRLRVAAAIGLPLTIAAIYSGISVSRHWEVTRNLDATRAVLEEARAKETDVEHARAAAFAHFDANESDAAEAEWARALSLAQATKPLLTRASERAEMTMTLDPSRADARDVLGEILFVRAVAAERERQTEAQDELLQRLALYDRRERWMRKWRAPAALFVKTTPSGATVTAARVTSDASGRRVEGPPRALGATPIADSSLEPGTYTLDVSSAGRASVRYPVTLARGEALDVAIDVPADDAIPPGFVYVPPGRFLFGTFGDEGQRRFFSTVPLHTRTTGGYIVARFETTFADWIDFVRALPPASRAARLPRVESGGFQGALSLQELPGDVFQLTLQRTDRTYVARSGEKLVYAGRDRRAAQDWLKFPVVGISADDAEAYVAWLARSGTLPGARLCTDLEWERAARGSDGRLYPHGDKLDADDANFASTYGDDPHAKGPDEVGAHPASASPFGAEDMCGNVWEFTKSSLGDGTYAARGGGYSFGATTGRSDNREVPEPSLRDVTVGMRVCADWPLPSALRVNVQ